MKWSQQVPSPSRRAVRVSFCVSFLRLLFRLHCHPTAPARRKPAENTPNPSSIHHQMHPSPRPLPLCVELVRQLYYQPASNPAITSLLQPPVPSYNRTPELPFNTIRALANISEARLCDTDSSYLACAEEFFEENPLLAATLQPATQAKYVLAVENFKLSPVANEKSSLSLDQRLSIYIQQQFTTNPRAGQRQEMSNLLCMLVLMYPSIRTQLGLARRCISGWKSLKPTQSAAPFTSQIVLALAWKMLANNKVAPATVLLISFAGCLRVSEALKLTCNDVALPGDLRIAAYPPGTAGLNIVDAKTARYSGKFQFVHLTDLAVIAFLVELSGLQHKTTDGIAPISYPKYSQELQEALKGFSIQSARFTSHSARIGKDTEDYIKGVSVGQIAINGRWKSLNSLRYYLTNGRAWILNAPLSIESQEQLAQAAREMKRALRISS